LTDSELIPGRPEGGLSRRELLKAGAGTLGALGAASVVVASSASPAAARTTPASVVHKGGQLRVAFVGGGTAETMDPNTAAADIDFARIQNLFDGLSSLAPSGGVQLELATAFEPNRDATTWTVTLRDGVTFHDGRMFTSADVLYSLRMYANPKLQSIYRRFAEVVDINRMRADGASRVVLPLSRPVGDLAQWFAAAAFVMVPAGTTSFAHPIGTGPFKYQSFQAGRSSLFVRNDAYWQPALPHVDSLELLSIPDETARFDALQQGSVDASLGLTLTQARSVGSGGGSLRVLRSDPSSQILGYYMDCTRPPFNDSRVRKALRLLANRSQMVGVAELGEGHVANDLYGFGLPLYDTGLPQISHDIEQAKSLLKQAGQSDLTVTLTASEIAAGLTESAQLYQQQAQAAGVTINLNTVPAASFYTSVYLKQPFVTESWYGNPIPPWYLATLVTGASYPETNYANPRLDSMIYAAFGALEPRRQAMLWDDVQRTLWDDGGYLWWGTQPFLDGLSSRVSGATPSVYAFLGDNDFKTWSLS
jgi:peptide/nickel transport system substrate-binding protein